MVVLAIMIGLVGCGGGGSVNGTPTPTPTPTPAPTPAPAGTDWILYQNAAGDVLVMNGDGSGQTTLLPHSAGCLYPTWSYGHLGFICATDPTVTRSTFVTYSTDGTAAGTKKLGTLDLVAIGGLDSASFPRYSPDGKSIVFTGFKQTVVGSATEDIEGVWAIGTDGTGLVEKAVEPYGDGVLIENPRFSPDGKKILYSKGQNVWTMDADGNNPNQLINATSSKAIFSPDMKGLYYVSGWGGASNIASVLANADGSNPVQISSNGLTVAGVSPNGKSIVLWDMTTSPYGVVTANADGSNQKNIAFGVPMDW